MGMARKAANTEAVEAPVETITSFKAFNADFQCAPKGTPFQFEVGKTYRVGGKIEACNNGFHAVDASNPFHVWDYYGVVGEDGRLTRYAEVEQSGAMDRESGDGGTKIASAEITVKVELTLPEFIKRGIAKLMELVSDKDKGVEAASGHSATLAASGHYATLAASGHYAKLAASGHSAKLAASGHYAKLAASGHYATLAASGHSAKLAASGHYATLAASGHSAKLAASGHYAKLAASGDSAKLAASGKDSVIASAGPYATASGPEGTWISLAEYRDGKCVGFATGCIGQDGLKPNTGYRAEGGKLVEAA